MVLGHASPGNILFFRPRCYISSWLVSQSVLHFQPVGIRACSIGRGKLMNDEVKRGQKAA